MVFLISKDDQFNILIIDSNIFSTNSLLSVKKVKKNKPWAILKNALLSRQHVKPLAVNMCSPL